MDDKDFIKHMTGLRFTPELKLMLEDEYKIPTIAYYESQRDHNWASFCLISELAPDSDWKRWTELNPELEWRIRYEPKWV